MKILQDMSSQHSGIRYVSGWDSPTINSTIFVRDWKFSNKTIQVEKTVKAMLGESYQSMWNVHFGSWLITDLFCNMKALI